MSVRNLPSRLLVAAMLVVLAVVTAACGGTPTATPVPPTATPVPPTATPVPPTATPVPPTVTPVPPTATPVPPTATRVPPTATSAPAAGGVSSADRELVLSAFGALMKAQSFGAKMTVEGQNEAIPFAGDIILEVSQVPTRSLYLKVGDQLELIVIGQDAYLKQGATPWLKSPLPPEQLQQLQEGLDFSSSIQPEDLAKMQLSKVGSEKVEGVDTEVFDVSIPSDQQVETSRVWISRADKTLVKQMQKDATSTVTMIFYNWNKVVIEPPKL
jgi:hypothetical protein